MKTRRVQVGIHGYQLAEQIVKSTRWLTPAKTGYDRK